MFTLISFALLATSNAHAFIIGDYADQFNLPVVCRLDMVMDPIGDAGLCSGTLVNQRFITIAKHCVSQYLVQTDQKILPYPKVICSLDGGRELMAKQVIDIRFFDQTLPVKEEKKTAADSVNDIALLALDHEVMPLHFESFNDVVQNVHSQAESTEILNHGRCFMSGWGQENLKGQPGIAGGAPGVLHSALPPTKKIYGSGKTMDGLVKSFFETGYRSKETQDLKVKLTQETPEVAMFGAMAFALDLEHPEADGSIMNALQPGDSGGPLLCLSSASDTKLIQVGIASQVVVMAKDEKDPAPLFQTLYTLLGRSDVLAWLQNSFKTMK